MVKAVGTPDNVFSKLHFEKTYTGMHNERPNSPSVRTGSTTRTRKKKKRSSNKNKIYERLTDKELYTGMYKNMAEEPRQPMAKEPDVIHKPSPRRTRKSSPKVISMAQYAGMNKRPSSASRAPKNASSPRRRSSSPRAEKLIKRHNYDKKAALSKLRTEKRSIEEQIEMLQRRLHKVKRDIKEINNFEDNEELEARTVFSKPPGSGLNNTIAGEELRGRLRGNTKTLYEKKEQWREGSYQSIFDKLTDHRLYTGTHYHRFHRDGSGRGIAGRRTYTEYGVPYDEISPRGTNGSPIRSRMNSPRRPSSAQQSPRKIMSGNVFQRLNNPSNFTGIQKAKKKVKKEKEQKKVKTGAAVHDISQIVRTEWTPNSPAHKRQRK
mmetsp:Transcript_7787/g.11549  ORF Transcript_7787/g.11549 Transcript_7787/m.11549 type:complete len:378 (+) Transcript_7787:77-1210(+)